MIMNSKTDLIYTSLLKLIISLFCKEQLEVFALLELQTLVEVYDPHSIV